MKMKVLFVSSGRNSSISPIVKSQGESLLKCGVGIHYFTIKGRGFTGYFRSIFLLRREIRKLHPDIVHAHYSLCCIVATLATRKPIVASLMGSDIIVSRWMTYLLRILSGYCWKATIVKSKNMKENIRIADAHIIPNGVDLSVFVPMDQWECKKRVGFDTSKKQILFMANPSRYAKNYELALQAFRDLQKNTESNAELKVVHGIGHDQVAYYINAADVVLMTSRWEGSPNIIKEALACNVPIVSTKVGDVEELFREAPGCYLADSTPGDISKQLMMALNFNGRTTGRHAVSHLDSAVIAKKITGIYETLIN